jgi:hypothetical protein
MDMRCAAKLRVLLKIAATPSEGTIPGECHQLTSAGWPNKCQLFDHAAGIEGDAGAAGMLSDRTDNSAVWILANEKVAF